MFLIKYKLCYLNCNNFIYSYYKFNYVDYLKTELVG